MGTGVFLEDEPIEIVGALEDKEGYALSDVTLQAVLDKAGVDYEWLDFFSRKFSRILSRNFVREKFYEFQLKNF